MGNLAKGREAAYAQVSVLLNALLVVLTLSLMLNAGKEIGQVYVLLLACSMVGGIAAVFDLGSKNWAIVMARGNIGFFLNPSFRVQLRKVAAVTLLGGVLVEIYVWLVLGKSSQAEWRMVLVFSLGEIIVEGRYRCFNGVLESGQRFYISRTVESLGRVLHLVLCYYAVVNENSLNLVGIAFLVPPAVKLFAVHLVLRRLNANPEIEVEEFGAYSSTGKEFAILNALGAIHSGYIKIASALFFGLETLVVIEVAMRLYGLMNLFSQSISSTLLPIFSNADFEVRSNIGISTTRRILIERQDRFISRSILCAAILLAAWLATLLEFFMPAPFEEVQITTLLLVSMPVVSAHNHVWVYGLISNGNVTGVRKIQVATLCTSVGLCSAFGWFFGSIGFALGFLCGAIYGAVRYSSLIYTFFSGKNEGSSFFRSLSSTLSALRRNAVLYVGYLAVAACSAWSTPSVLVATLISIPTISLVLREFVLMTKHS